jgi:hypothetical protein
MIKDLYQKHKHYKIESTTLDKGSLTPNQLRTLLQKT